VFNNRRLYKQISRADVLNLTSTEAGHNHPKLYKALLKDVEEKTSLRANTALSTPEEAPSAQYLF
jgi:4-aminobutyrate aminotransferase-like enzyme